MDIFDKRGYYQTGNNVRIVNSKAMLEDGRPLSVSEVTTTTWEADDLYVPEVSEEENQFDHQYNRVLKRILKEGERRDDRTKTGTISLFGDVNMKFDLRLNFPAITGKLLAFKTMRGETCDWMLKGKSDLRTLKELGIRIWDQNVKPGTEVYQGRLLEFGERVRMLTANQLVTFTSYKDDYFAREDATEGGWLEFAEMKLNNWGVPEHEQLSLSGRIALCPKDVQDEINEYCLVKYVPCSIKTDVPHCGYDNLPEELKAEINGRLDELGFPSEPLYDGDLGPIYGQQWCHYPDIRLVESDVYRAKCVEYDKRGFDVEETVGYEGPTGYVRTHVVLKREINQIAQIEEAIKNEILFHDGKLAKHSAGRRIILTGWNVAYLDEMSLPPCHTLAQWYVSSTKDENGKYYLDCKLYLRSNDIFLGNPFNVAQYAMITEMLAHAHGLTARHYHVTVGDAHIYSNHKEQVREQLRRPVIHKAPKLKIDCGPVSSITEIPSSCITLENYTSYETIKAPIAGN